MCPHNQLLWTVAKQNWRFDKTSIATSDIDTWDSFYNYIKKDACQERIEYIELWLKVKENEFVVAVVNLTRELDKINQNNLDQGVDSWSVLWKSQYLWPGG